MGPPDLPSDPGQDESLSPTQQVYNMTSDSDNDSINDGGYQLLPMSDENIPMEQDDDNDVTTISTADMATTTIEQLASPNVPHVESIDAEIERQVWSEPRPQELQIELDNTKTTQILNAMANFTLPNVVVPEWAAGVPEELWKAELLQRIRRRTEMRVDNVSNGGETTTTEAVQAD